MSGPFRSFLRINFASVLKGCSERVKHGFLFHREPPNQKERGLLSPSGVKQTQFRVKETFFCHHAAAGSGLSAQVADLP